MIAEAVGKINPISRVYLDILSKGESIKNNIPTVKPMMYLKANTEAISLNCRKSNLKLKYIPKSNNDIGILALDMALEKSIAIFGKCNPRIFITTAMIYVTNGIDLNTLPAVSLISSFPASSEK